MTWSASSVARDDSGPQLKMIGEGRSQPLNSSRGSIVADFDSEGVQIAYSDTPAEDGPGQGRPILLIHGFASSGRSVGSFDTDPTIDPSWCEAVESMAPIICRTTKLCKRLSNWPGNTA